MVIWEKETRRKNGKHEGREKGEKEEKENRVFQEDKKNNPSPGELFVSCPCHVCFAECGEIVCAVTRLRCCGVVLSTPPHVHFPAEE